MTKYIAYCNNSCCPSITIAEGSPLLIEDDYDGAISLIPTQFQAITQWFKDHKNETVFDLQNCPKQFVGYGLVAKLYAIGEDRMISVYIREVFVQKITFEQWQVFVDRVDEHPAVLA